MRLAFLALLLSIPPVYGQTFTVWSYQLPTGGVRHSHTWATWEMRGESVCISWGPVDAVKILKRKEPGRNQTHEETLGWARVYGAEVRRLGPFPCSREMFARAKVQKLRLESGLVEYKAVAIGFGPRRANCYSAVAQIGRGTFAGGTLYGHEASRAVADFLLWGDR